MNRIFILSINGSTYLFERNKISDDNIKKIRNIAVNFDPKEKLKNDDQIYIKFVCEIKSKLNIELKKILVTDVIRININNYN